MSYKKDQIIGRILDADDELAWVQCQPDDLIDDATWSTIVDIRLKIIDLIKDLSNKESNKDR